MSLSLSDLSVGQQVKIIDTSDHCFDMGEVVEVTYIGSYDLTAKSKVGTTQYLNISQVEAVAADPLLVFQQEVVDKAMAAAKVHGWCSEVTRVLREDLGLGDLLPVSKVVEVVVRVNVEAPAGTNEPGLRRLGHQAVTFDGSRAWVESSRVID